jgi:hypothetical protein
MKNKNHKSIAAEKPLALVLVKKIEGEEIKLYAVGHEAISQDTMGLIEDLGEKLLLIPEIRANVPMHKEQRVPIFRVILEREDVLCQTKYDITGNVSMLQLVANIREQILKDIDIHVSKFSEFQ